MRITRLEALRMVDELLTAQAVFLERAAQMAPREQMLEAIQRRDTLRFRLVQQLAPTPLVLRAQHAAPATSGAEPARVTIEVREE